MSELLALAYLIAWITALARFGTHVYEGYAWYGLFRETLFELLTVVAGLVSAVYAINLEQPQVPLMIACAAAATGAFLLSATELEDARVDLARRDDGIRLRRASDVLRDSWAWEALCRRAHRLDADWVRELRARLAGADSEDGMLSRAAFVAFCVFAALAVAAGGLAIVGIAMGVPITPAPPEKEGTPPGKDRNKDHKTRRQAPRGGVVSPQDPPPDDNAEATNDCDPFYDPGKRVPRPQRTSLALAWHEVDGVPTGEMEALGVDIAGCPGRPWPLPGKPEWWYAAGYCAGHLRAVAIAPPGVEHPIVLLEQAAEFAMPLITARKFENATDRFDVGDGDAYVIDSAGGSNVLIREHNTAGPVRGARNHSGGCNNYVNEDVPYAILDPKLISGWRAAAAISQGGVYPIPSNSSKAGVEVVLFHSPAGIVAEGRCWHDHASCGIKIESEWIMGTAGTRITEPDIEALAEP